MSGWTTPFDPARTQAKINALQRKLETDALKKYEKDKKSFDKAAAKQSKVQEKGRVKVEKEARKRENERVKREIQEEEKWRKRDGRRVDGNRKSLFGLAISDTPVVAETPFGRGGPSLSPRRPVPSMDYDTITLSRMFPDMSLTSARAIVALKEERWGGRGGR